MGNSCGIVAVKKVVTVGGKRHQQETVKKPYKLKSRARKKTTVTAKDAKTEHTAIERVKKDTANSDSTKAVNQSVSKRDSAKKSHRLKPVVVGSKPSKEDKTKTTYNVGYKNNFNNCNEKGTQNLPVENTKHQFQEPMLNNKQKMILCQSSSSDFSSDFSTSHPNKRFNKECFFTQDMSTEWQQEERRLQLERKTIEEHIKTSIKDEYRAKAVTQSWLVKLENLTSQQYTHLVRRAETLHCKLRDAETLMTYHEVRTYRMQRKHNIMKDLLESAKREENARKAKKDNTSKEMEKIFHEKLFFLEAQLRNLQNKLTETQTKGFSANLFNSKFQSTESFKLGRSTSKFNRTISNYPTPNSLSSHKRKEDLFTLSTRCRKYSRHCQPVFTGHQPLTSPMMYNKPRKAHLPINQRLPFRYRSEFSSYSGRSNTNSKTLATSVSNHGDNSKSRAASESVAVFSPAVNSTFPCGKTPDLNTNADVYFTTTNATEMLGSFQEKKQATMHLQRSLPRQESSTNVLQNVSDLITNEPNKFDKQKASFSQSGNQASKVHLNAFEDSCRQTIDPDLTHSSQSRKNFNSDSIFESKSNLISPISEKAGLLTTSPDNRENDCYSSAGSSILMKLFTSNSSIRGASFPS